ncbi:lipopolysaccharide kinase InaA family protein [Pseudotamlana carrageenivorans]|uniref:Kdo domain containing protein n=1 Tax=Pseudotamlana carrageenivorans TaxID=2069432 RepID=A0A2I7SDK4_9FLAO|nr:lipopolysaccharide kinase InaA family protein [Tamlana carrageenivorans]AUS03982.1 Kdo domain containing protein [Tamlana carrageenivorans]
MNYMINKLFQPFETKLTNYIINFDNLGEDYGNQDRNSLKLFQLEGQTLNVKSFRIPNIINQIAYRFFRKSKAQRSFEYAIKLKELGVGTPMPIAYYEFKTPFLFKKSFYISEQLDYDFTYRALTTNYNIPNYEAILRAFTRFTFQLHEKGIHFLDHSPGNTLIQLNSDDYKFYIVDLNRMDFKELDFETRIKNFSRLSTQKYMVEIMSDEYAKCLGENYDKVFKLMWRDTEAFQEKYHKRRRLKNKLKFWK